MTKKNILYGLIGLINVIIGFLGKTIYRDYINLNMINDHGIAGFLPSYFYVAGFSLLLLIRPARYPDLVILFTTVASILFEIKEYISTGNLDIKDILASAAGGLTAFIIRKIVDSKYSH